MPGQLYQRLMEGLTGHHLLMDQAGHQPGAVIRIRMGILLVADDDIAALHHLRSDVAVKIQHHADRHFPAKALPQRTEQLALQIRVAFRHTCAMDIHDDGIQGRFAVRRPDQLHKLIPKGFKGILPCRAAWRKVRTGGCLQLNVQLTALVNDTAHGTPNTGVGPDVGVSASGNSLYIIRIRTDIAEGIGFVFKSADNNTHRVLPPLYNQSFSQPEVSCLQSWGCPHGH